MDIDKLYKVAKNRHGQLNKDAVHDLFCRFGSDLPSDAYLNTCLQHNKPLPLQEKFEDFFELEEDHSEDSTFENTLSTLSTAVNNVRQTYEIEVDTFLECHVNGSYKAFSESSGIARSVLEKICKFAKYEILTEFIRLESLD
jgi:hypothetical protein